MIITITGSSSSLGQKLYSKLFSKYHIEKIDYGITHENEIYRILATTSIVFHLEEVKNPKNEIDLYKINTEFTQDICNILVGLNNKATIVYLSVYNSPNQTSYLLSKTTSEFILHKYGRCTIIKPLSEKELSIDYIIGKLIEQIKPVNEPTYISI
jgi:UDP-2-acetamido-2,6-beta-L-arabino-hexul-4-ose reductase